MITAAIAATAAIRMTLSPGIQLAAWRSQPGGSRAPITLSRMILSGQGAARLIAVSIAVAKRIAATERRYGRSSPATRRPMPLAADFPSVGGLITHAPPEVKSAASGMGRLVAG